MKQNKIKIKPQAPVYSEKFGIANWLTITRLLLMIPFIAIMSTMFGLAIAGKTSFYYEGVSLKGTGYKLAYSLLYWINVAIFIAAMITDFVDGYYARKTKTITAFGKIFDPIADKVATTLMLIFLAVTNMSYLPIIVLFIVRDIIVDGTRIYAIKKNVKVQANIWGKVKTILISLAIIAIAFAGPWLVEAKKTITNSDGTTMTVKNHALLFYLNIPLVLALTLSWTSGIIYMFKYLKGIKKDIRDNNTLELEFKDKTPKQVNKTSEELLQAENNKQENTEHNTEDPDNKINTNDQKEKTDPNIQIDFSKTEIFE